MRARWGGRVAGVSLAALVSVLSMACKNAKPREEASEHASFRAPQEAAFDEGSAQRAAAPAATVEKPGGIDRMFGVMREAWPDWVSGQAKCGAGEEHVHSGWAAGCPCMDRDSRRLVRRAALQWPGTRRPAMRHLVSRTDRCAMRSAIAHECPTAPDRGRWNRHLQISTARGTKPSTLALLKRTITVRRCVELLSLCS
jgi:hypothetical protein